MASCPACAGKHIGPGYRPVALPLRLIGIRSLLCGDCNLPFRAFSPLPPRPRRARRVNYEAETCASAAAALPHCHIPLAVNLSLLEAQPTRESHSARHACPRCGSGVVARRHRRLWERACFALTDTRAYNCVDCGGSFYDKRAA